MSLDPLMETGPGNVFRSTNYYRFEALKGLPIREINIRVVCLYSKGRFLALKCPIYISHNLQQRISPLNPPHKGPTDAWPPQKKLL